MDVTCNSSLSAASPGQSANRWVTSSVGGATGGSSAGPTYRWAHHRQSLLWCSWVYSHPMWEQWSVRSWAEIELTLLVRADVVLISVVLVDPLLHMSGHFVWLMGYLRPRSIGVTMVYTGRVESSVRWGAPPPGMGDMVILGSGYAEGRIYRLPKGGEGVGLVVYIWYGSDIRV